MFLNKMNKEGEFLSMLAHTSTGDMNGIVLSNINFREFFEFCEIANVFIKQPCATTICDILEVKSYSGAH